MRVFQKQTKYSVYYILFVLLNICFVSNIQAQVHDKFILIISSYNPETRQTASNISAFLDEYKALGGELSVIIENMNCKSFSESKLWKQQMNGILDKYEGENTPSLIILLGQEAWSAYLSQDKKSVHKIPVMCGMVSRNALILPEDSVVLENWEPESIDAFSDVKGINIVAGYAYQYYVDKNIELIKELYPNTRNLAFVTDNTYGGVSMQAYVRQKMREFPELNLILLDGRKHTIYTIVGAINQLPENTAMLLGTWRVDKNEGYFMRNATYAMKDANPDLPVFTLASVGLGYWAIGGYIPNYLSVGKDMARQAVDYFNKGEGRAVEIEFVSGHYAFDVTRMKEMGIPLKKVPSGSELINKKESFFEQYKYQILGFVTAFAALLIGFVVAVYYYFRTKKLSDDLLESEGNLRVAKDKAEESNRLKTAFLANMSHEIRTPLNAIVGFSNVLAVGGSSEEDQRKYFEIIQTNSDLLLHLINDILDISRLEAGRIKFVFDDCDVIGLCRNVISTSEYARKTEAKYIFNPSIETYMLRTDVQRLQQVLINLLSNASKFTPEGTITLDCRIEEKEQMAYFSVTDTGCGIPLDKQALVFERFEKLNEYAQGTGLGLSICKLIVNKLGGNIWVDPEYKDGARFVFSHPLHIVEQDD